MLGSRESKTTRRGKKEKKFVESKDAALELASSIAGTLEENSSKKVAKNRQIAQTTVSRSEIKSRSSSKAKLHEVKAALKIEKARAKREKMRARKSVRGEVSTAASSGSFSTLIRQNGSPTMRKRVAFA